MSGDSANSNPKLPPWLRGVPLPPRPVDEAAPGGVASAAAGMAAPPEIVSEGALPEWLRSHAATPAAGGPDELPAWLRSAAPDEAAPVAEPTQASQAPSTNAAASPVDHAPAWLHSMREEAPARVEADVPAWLRDAEPAGGADRPKQEVLPTAPQEQKPPTPSRPRAELLAEETEGVPTWLRNISADEVRQVMAEDTEGITVEPFTFEGATAPPEPQAPAGLPPWLSDVADEPAAETSSWLDQMTSEPDESPDAPLDDESVPEWLRKLGSTPLESEAGAAPSPEPPVAAEPFQAPSAPDLPAERGQAADLPAWLSEAEAPPSADAVPAGDLPPWLHAPSAEPAPPAGEVPGWVQPEAPVLPPEASAPAGELPGWLQAEAPGAAPHEPALSEELPSWLRDEPAAAPAQEPPVPREDLPSWLRAEPPPIPTTDTSPESLPGWLQPVPEESVAPAPEPPAFEPHVEAPDDLPPWLRDEGGVPLPTAGAPGDANLPQWLRGASIDREQPPPEVPAEATPEPAAQAETPTGAPPDLNWFDERGEGQAEGEAEESGFLGGMDLPAWLRAPEPAPAPEISAADARSLDWLTRLSPLEEDESVVATATARLAPPAAPTRSAAQLAAVALLEQLAADPFPESTPLPTAARPQLWRRIGIERVLYLLLLAALVAALFVPSLATALQTTPQVASAPLLFERISALSAQDVVLISYEWDARRISELQPLQEAVLDQLIQQQVKMVLVSTDPQGTLLSYNLRDKLEAAGYRAGGLDYILLGYKPGGELALRQLAHDFRGVLGSDFQGSDATVAGLANGLGTNKPLMSLNDFSMLIILADEPVDVQGWMEQVHPSAPQVPIAFLLPAESAPIVQPYVRQQGQQIYYLAGKRGALAYQSLRGGAGTPDDDVMRQSGQERIGLVVFVALLAFGALIVSIAALFSQRRNPS